MVDRNNFHILIIDDNPAIHEDFIQILNFQTDQELDNLSSILFNDNKEKPASPHYKIDVASQGEEGVALIKEALNSGKKYSLAFVDIRMPPGWNGIETIKQIWRLDKSIQIVICTAYSDYSWEETVAHLGKRDNLLILKKPFDSVSVRQLACALTTKWQLELESKDYTKSLQKKIVERTVSLHESLSLIKSTFEASNDGIIVINNNGEIIDYNTNLINMLNIPKPILTSRREEIFFDHLKKNILNPQEFDSAINELKADLDKFRINIIKFNNGKTFEWHSQPHRLNKSTVGVILNFRDITTQTKLQEDLQYQAKHDMLTGLMNRASLFDSLDLAIKTCQLHNDQFSLLFIDLDRFKLVNDNLSHAAGDELLKSAAMRLQSSLRKEDILARFGGDEFVIILMGVGKCEQIEVRVNDLLKVFHQPFVLDNRKVTITISIGISIFPLDGTSQDILLRNADAAMYCAKAQSGNNYKFFNQEMNAHTLAIFNKEGDLRNAIANQEFFLVYQPQVDLKHEKLVAVEALIRWNHPEEGVLLPHDFISLAEETGLILQIGEWVLRTACNQNKIWQDKGLPHIRVAVNVVAQQFGQHNLPGKIREILDSVGLDPQYLEIELAETAILSNIEIMDDIAELKKMGVKIAIDDFGTGYSTLSYLHKIPLDRLKIDRSFIKYINSNADHEVIVCAIIAMAKQLHLQVIAEGVETVDQLNLLKHYDCGDVQGFYFSEPLDAEKFENFLSEFGKDK